jgi:hypothetical protein
MRPCSPTRPFARTSMKSSDWGSRRALWSAGGSRGQVDRGEQVREKVCWPVAEETLDGGGAIGPSKGMGSAAPAAAAATEPTCRLGGAPLRRTVQARWMPATAAPPSR